MELPDENAREWPLRKVAIKDLKLDDENPRLALADGATQQEIRNALFSEGKVLNLIESILENGGLFPGENIIALEENGVYRVLEGNRRLCAIQCLLDPSLAPDDSRDQIEKLLDNATMDVKTIDPINTWISPSWEAAQPTITARHSKYEIEKWSLLSKWRRDYLHFKKTGSIENVSRVFNENINDVVGNIKNFVLIDYIRRIPSFSPHDKEILNDNDLSVSQLTWHLSKEMREFLGIDYDSYFNLKVNIDEKKFEYLMKEMAKAAFLVNPPRISTRVNKEDVMSFVRQLAQYYDNTHSRKKEPEPKGKQPNVDPTPKVGTNGTQGGGKTGSGGKSNVKSRKNKPEQYFASLNRDITVNDQRMIRLTYELAKNDMKDRPATGILLARSLIESALLYRLDQKGLTEQMLKEHGKGVEDMKLSEILRFSINNIGTLFKDSKSAKKCLEKIQSDHREYMNSIVHGTWLDPNAGEVEKIAGTTRELLRTILTDAP